MTAFLEQHDLFAAGDGGYAGYRIPALTVTTRGTILAFCEARKFTGQDTDQIDLFLRRSFDHGKTFAGIQVVASVESWVSGNPAPVVDRDTGLIWLLFTRNPIDGDETAVWQGKAMRTVWVTSSDDDGATWTEPREITASVKRNSWSWYATGPGHGVQLRNGRLVIPCDHGVLQKRDRQADPYHSHVIFSDDHGRTWRVGGIVDEGTNESMALETADGWLYLNCRNKRTLEMNGETGVGNYRAVAWSADGGESFTPIVHDAALPEPICQASVARLSDTRHHDRNRVLFANPGTCEERRAMTVRLSYDECRTWPVARLLHGGPAAYSDLCVTADMTICCFYERGEERPYERLTLARFNLAWLTEERDTIEAVMVGGRARSTSPAPEDAGYRMSDRNLFTAMSYARLAWVMRNQEEIVCYEPSASDAFASLTTRPLPLRGKGLLLDAEIEPGGSLFVTVLDSNGKEIADSEPVLESLRAEAVSWSDGWTFSQSVRPMALKFVLKRARLYGFYFDEATP